MYFFGTYFLLIKGSLFLFKNDSPACRSRLIKGSVLTFTSFLFGSKLGFNCLDEEVAVFALGAPACAKFAVVMIKVRITAAVLMMFVVFFMIIIFSVI